MPIAAADLFKSAPRMSKAGFVQILQAAQSPFAPDAERVYDLIVSKHHDPAVWLAICRHEHEFGTNSNSVIARMNTKSWTNARTVRDPSLTQFELVQDPVRLSTYVRYASYLDSVRD